MFELVHTKNSFMLSKVSLPDVLKSSIALSIFGTISNEQLTETIAKGLINFVKIDLLKSGVKLSEFKLNHEDVLVHNTAFKQHFYSRPKIAFKAGNKKMIKIYKSIVKHVYFTNPPLGKDRVYFSLSLLDGYVIDENETEDLELLNEIMLIPECLQKVLWMVGASGNKDLINYFDFLAARHENSSHYVNEMLTGATQTQDKKKVDLVLECKNITSFQNTIYHARKTSLIKYLIKTCKQRKMVVNYALQENKAIQETNINLLEYLVDSMYKRFVKNEHYIQYLNDMFIKIIKTENIHFSVVRFIRKKLPDNLIDVKTIARLVNYYSGEEATRILNWLKTNKIKIDYNKLYEMPECNWFIRNYLKHNKLVE